MSPPLSAALQLVRRLELRQRARWVFGLLDAALAAPTAAASAQMRLVRRVGMEYLPMNRAVLHRLGVIPAVDRYYDPFVSDRHLRHSLDDVRSLPGLDLHEADYEALFRALGAWGQEPIEGPLEGRSSPISTATAPMAATTPRSSMRSSASSVRGGSSRWAAATPRWSPCAR